MTTQDISKFQDAIEIDEILDQYIADCGVNTLFSGDRMRFNGQTAEYKRGWPERLVPIGSEMVAIVPEIMRGFRKFENGRFIHEIGRLFSGFRLPTRESLGDLDQKLWGTGLDGKPRDPWGLVDYLPMQDGDGALLCFVAANRTSRSALGILTQRYKGLRSRHPGEVPVVGLAKNKLDNIGQTPVPFFEIRSWRTWAPVQLEMIPDAGDQLELSPELPKILAR